MAVGEGRADQMTLGEPDARATPRRRLWASRSPGKIVVRYADGRVLKGYADFDPDAPAFLLSRLDEPDGEAVEVSVAALKAIFFVRSFDGDSRHDESKDLYQTRPEGTRKVSLQFRDGEELVGHTRQLDRHRTGLFFTPLDPGSNNLRVFAVFSALWGVQRLL